VGAQTETIWSGSEGGLAGVGGTDDDISKKAVFEGRLVPGSAADGTDGRPWRDQAARRQSHGVWKSMRGASGGMVAFWRFVREFERRLVTR